jgi:hypothetical protein
MPKRLSKKRRTADPNVSAFRVTQRIIERTEGEAPTRQPRVIPLPSKRKNPAAVALGRKGGQASARGRMEKIDAENRRRIASHAARVRWAKEKANG